MTANASVTALGPNAVTPSRLGTATVVGVLCALGGNAFLYCAARTFGVSFLLPAGSAPVELGLSRVVLATALAGFGAAGLLAVLGQLSRGPERSFRFLSTAALLLSFVPIASLDADGATRVTLALMNIVAAATYVLAFTPPAACACEDLGCEGAH
ncbi:MAG TPA: DUF6069 family protein [Longimicrobium sp.]|nr:DUF6069 family protein [Longimicrobium sp.]